MTTIIGFSGKMGSGKDYTATLVNEGLLSENGYYTSFSMAFGNILRDEIEAISSMYKTTESTIADLASHFSSTENEMNNLITLLTNDEGFYYDNYTIYKRTKKSREILQYWGTEVRRKQSLNYWIDRADEIISKHNETFIFVTDVRFPNEYDLIKKWNGIMVRCEVSPELQALRLKTRDKKSANKGETVHSSETALDSHFFDIKVDTGLPKAADKIVTFIHKEAK